MVSDEILLSLMVDAALRCYEMASVDTVDEAVDKAKEIVRKSLAATNDLRTQLAQEE